MKNAIYPCIWFDGQAKDAAEYYCSIFQNSGIIDDTPMVVTFELDGVKFMGLNGGPTFKPNPAISFYVVLDKEEQVQKVWERLSDGGMVLMALDKYDWSEKYGWVQDRFGVSWQISLGESRAVGQRFVPLLMYCGEQQGRAAEALQYYTDVFNPAKTESIVRYEPGQVSLDATVVHARFRLNNGVFMAMDSAVPQPFTFNEGVSLVIDCDTQEEIDYYWERLTDGGSESQCGWLKDRFGVSWQVVPTVLAGLLQDPAKSARVMQAFMQMKKFNIEQLVNA